VLVARQVPDVGAARHQPLVALGQVPGVHGFGVEVGAPITRRHRDRLVVELEVT
jgi:hypothetical protein